MNTDEAPDFDVQLRKIMDERYAPLDETADSISDLDGRIALIEQTVREILVQMQDLRRS